MFNNVTVVTGAGGFIGGALVRHLKQHITTPIRAVDKKPLCDWYQETPGVENLCLDVSQVDNCHRVCEGAGHVYNLAADMGGMGFIERFRVECMRSVLINTNLIEAAYKAGVAKYFFASSACAYNTELQKTTDCAALKESDAYPAMAERGYGWEKLYGEMLCQEYWAERKMPVYIARFHNVYGPYGTWDGGREKAPAAICRKVIECIDTNKPTIEIWGDGSQTRSYQYIDDCVTGITKIVNCDALIGVPINLGSSEMVSVNQLVDLAAEHGAVSLERVFQLDAPKGVAGRNSDNTMIKAVLGWEPTTALKDGLGWTYNWISRQYYDRKAGKRTVRDTL